MPQPPQLRVGTDWVTIIVIGPVDVIATLHGYAPVLPVRKENMGQEYILYISAKSLSEQLEPLRQINGGGVQGLKFSIRKESEDQMAKYQLQAD